MYTPYFYVIQHLPSGKYYAGSKWGKTEYKQKQRSAIPAFLMTEGGYLTSSAIVKKIINEEGLSSFVVRIIRTFDTPEKARQYETKFLRKVKAKTNDKFFNMHENSLIAWGTEEHKCASLKKYGVEHPTQTSEIKEKIKSSTLISCGVEYGFLLDKSRDAMRAKYGVDYAMQSSEIQETRKKNTLEKYGVDHHMKDKKTSSKMINAKLEKYGAKCSPNEVHATVNRNKTRSKRPNVLTIIKIKNKHNLTLDKNWWMRCDEYIDKLLQDLQLRYDND